MSKGPETSSGGQLDEEKAAVLTEEDRKKIEEYNVLDARFRTDKKFADTITAALKGEYDSIPALIDAKKKLDSKEDKTADEKGELAELNKAIGSIATRLESVQNGIADRDIRFARSNIDGQYQEEFARLARGKGYIPNTPAFDNLFDSVVEESRKIAGKYGLMTKDGFVDPLLKFSKDMIGESFKKAVSKHVEMGYDPEEQRRRLKVREREQKEVEEKERFQKFFSKETLQRGTRDSSVLGRAMARWYDDLLHRAGD